MRYKSKIYFSDRLSELGNDIDEWVMCSGCYDVLHSGHLYFFEQCCMFGSKLVVSIGSDVLIKKLKGKTRPINPLMNRAYLLAGLDIVDAVVVGADDCIDGKIDFYQSLPLIKPQTFVLNDDDGAIQEKRNFCEKHGVKLELVTRELPEKLAHRSTTSIAAEMNQ